MPVLLFSCLQKDTSARGGVRGDGQDGATAAVVVKESEAGARSVAVEAVHVPGAVPSAVVAAAAGPPPASPRGVPVEPLGSPAEDDSPEVGEPMVPTATSPKLRHLPLEQEQNEGHAGKGVNSLAAATAAGVASATAAGPLATAASSAAAAEQPKAATEPAAAELATEQVAATERPPTLEEAGPGLLSVIAELDDGPPFIPAPGASLALPRPASACELAWEPSRRRALVVACSTWNGGGERLQWAVPHAHALVDALTGAGRYVAAGC